MDSVAKDRSILDEVQDKTLEIIDALAVLENRLLPVISPSTTDSKLAAGNGAKPAGSHLFTVNSNLNTIRDQITYISESLVI